MARSGNIREDIKLWVDELVRLYEMTDPIHGQESEIGKDEYATIAIDLSWRLHAELVGWAQSYQLGQSILTHEPEFVEKLEKLLGKKINYNSHDLEFIGWRYVVNQHGDVGLEERKVEVAFDQLDEEEECDKVLTGEVMRAFIVELLMSQSHSSSFWRLPLQESLSALNHGEVYDLAVPASARKQGRPYHLLIAKMRAVEQVRYRVGLGVKKYRALESVGNAIGQSPETLRAWEKETEKNFDMSIRLKCAELAGELRDELKAKEWDYKRLEDPMYYGSSRGTLIVDIARARLSDVSAHGTDLSLG